MNHSILIRLETLLLFFFFFAASSLAGTIKGRIVDQQHTAIEFANVALYMQGDPAPVKGTVADVSGNFIIEGIKNGSYLVRISYIGYAPQEKTIQISDQNKTTNLHTITLKEDSELLSEVNITAQKAAMRLEVDKRVFDVASSITAVGLSASEALESIPSVEVDQEGNISLRGSSSVTVWINGKAQGMTSDNRGDILQQLPAESIERIEVITNPSSKYSPEGSAGIINIILKRDRKAGYYGGVQLSMNQQQDHSPLGGRFGANINYSSGILEAYANIGIGKRVHKGGGWNNRDYVYEDETEDDGVHYGFLNQTSANRMKHKNMFMRTGLTWHFTAKDEIGVSYMGMQGLGKNKRLSDYDYASGLYDTPEATALFNAHPELAFSPYTRSRSNVNSGKPHMNNVTVNYRHEWKTNHTLEASVTWNKWSADNESSYNQETNYASGKTTNTYQGQESTMGNRNWEFQMDYTQPLSETSKIEAGYKGVLFHENSPTETWSDPAHQHSVYSLFNRFIYDQNTQAFYLNYQNKVGKNFGYQLGLRAEYWKVETESYNYDQEYNTNVLNIAPVQPFEKDFFKLFPTVFLSYSLPHDQELQFNYTRRLHRPWGGQMNSFKNISDSTSISFGYPELTPSYSNSFELNYLKTWDNHTISASAYYRPSDNIIQSVSYMEDGIRYSTNRNIASDLRTGIELIAKNKLWNILDLTTTFNAFYYELDGGTFSIYDQGKFHDVIIKSDDDFSWNASEMVQLMLPHSISFQATGRYNAASVITQGKREASYMLDLGMKKTFFDKKLTLSLNCRNALDSRKDHSKTYGNGYSQETKNWRGGRRFMVQLSYSFGNMSGRRDRRGDGEGGRDYNGESGEEE